MTTNTLHILGPSVNNLTARIFVRASGVDFDEVNVWGKRTEPDFLAKNPSGLTPLLECDDLPRGALWESCAIMAYVCNRDGLDELYPTDPGERAMVDSAMFYVVATLYPLIGRACYATLGFPFYPGETGASDAADDVKAQAQAAASAALAAPLEAIHTFFLDGRPFIGGERPGIADFRLAASLEFLRAIDYEFEAWTEDYLAAVETSLGDAYTEPAADVRGYIASLGG